MVIDYRQLCVVFFLLKLILEVFYTVYVVFDQIKFFRAVETLE